MLNSNEIKDLEKRWGRFRTKRVIKYYLMPLISFLALIGLYFFFSHYFFELKEENKMSTVTKDKKSSYEEKKESKTNLSKSNHAKIKKVTKNSIETKNITLEKNISEKMESKIGIKTNITEKRKRDDLILLNRQFLDNIYGKTTKSVKTDNSSKDIKEDSIYKKSDKNRTDNNIGSKIIISSRKIDKTGYYKKRFLDSKKVKYAIELSKIYFVKKEYKKSLRWAIISNGIDSNSEDSWILFAKNKVKLGRGDEAVNALSVYLRVHDSKKVKRLLSDIKKGLYR